MSSSSIIGRNAPLTIRAAEGGAAASFTSPRRSMPKASIRTSPRVTRAPTSARALRRFSPSGGRGSVSTNDDRRLSGRQTVFASAARSDAISGQGGDGGLNPAGAEWHSRRRQTKLDAAQRADQHQLVEVADVANAKDTALEPAEPRPERHVVAVEHDRAEPIGVVSVRHDHRRDDGTELVVALAQNLQAPGANRRARGSGKAQMAVENPRQPFFGQHVQRFTKTEQQIGRRRRREVSARRWRRASAPRPSTTRGNPAWRDAASARSLMALKLRPGGNIKPFCDPASVTSSPHSSWRRSIDPSDDTASTSNSAGCAAASIACRMAGRRLVTPVDVSLWTTSTARIRCSRSRASRSPRSAGSTPRRQVPGTRLDREPEPAGDLGPVLRELADVECEHRVARGERVDERRFPRAAARRRIDHDG